MPSRRWWDRKQSFHDHSVISERGKGGGGHVHHTQDIRRPKDVQCDPDVECLGVCDCDLLISFPLCGTSSGYTSGYISQLYVRVIFSGLICLYRQVISGSMVEAKGC